MIFCIKTSSHFVSFYEEWWKVAKELTFTINVIINNQTKPFEELTASEQTDFKKSMTQRLSDTMSRYYSNHIDEYKKLIA